MAKYTIDIPDYKFVRKRTTGHHEYGENAHLCSCLEFYYSQDRKATLEDMQTLRDMADNRIGHYWNNMYVPLDMEYSHL